MILFHDIPHADYLKTHVDAGTLRAAGVFDHGRFAGFGMATAETTMELKSAQVDVCSSVADCLGLLLSAITGVQSPYVPAPYNLFALLELESGQQRTYASAVREVGRGPQGVQSSVAYAFGAPGVHAVVEVVGHRLEVVRDHLLELTDLSQVRSVETLVVSPERAYGWGQPEALRE